MRKNAAWWTVLALTLLCSFARSASAQNSAECNITPPTTFSVVAGQSFTLGWCDSALDQNGNPTTLTGFRVYRNNVVVTGLNIITDAANAAGLRYSHGQSSEPIAGTFQYAVTALNATGESIRAVITLTVTPSVPPPAVPAPPTLLRVTVP